MRRELQKNLDASEDEIEDLVRAIYQVYGYDFSDYSKASRKRRLETFMRSQNWESVAAIKEKALADRAFCVELIDALTVSTTELFRDPSFYVAVRRILVPVLKSYASFKIWHAGCSTGEEVFSTAILLGEEGLLDRAIIYATDINKLAVDKARKGIVAAQSVKRDSKNYFDSGGKRALSEYWSVRHGYALLNREIHQRIVYAEHNLATDHAFGEMQVIFCRNVMIYFNQSLRARALELFRDCLSRGGFLCLGSKETLSFSTVDLDFAVASKRDRIYQKKARL